MEFIGSKRVHASAQKSFEFATRDTFSKLFGDVFARADTEKLTLEWNAQDLSGTLEVVPSGPSQADLTLKVRLEAADNARVSQIPAQMEAALERVRDALEAEE